MRGTGSTTAAIKSLPRGASTMLGAIWSPDDGSILGGSKKIFQQYQATYGATIGKTMISSDGSSRRQRCQVRLEARRQPPDVEILCRA